MDLEGGPAYVRIHGWNGMEWMMEFGDARDGTARFARS